MRLGNIANGLLRKGGHLSGRDGAAIPPETRGSMRKGIDLAERKQEIITAYEKRGSRGGSAKWREVKRLYTTSPSLNGSRGMVEALLEFEDIDMVYDQEECAPPHEGMEQDQEECAIPTEMSEGKAEKYPFQHTSPTVERTSQDDYEFDLGLNSGIES